MYLPKYFIMINRKYSKSAKKKKNVKIYSMNSGLYSNYDKEIIIA